MVEHSQSAGPAGTASSAGKSTADGLSEAVAVAAKHWFAGRMKQAEAACLDLVKSYPNNAKPFQLLGDLLQRTARAGAAIVPFERALQLNPNFADAYLGYGNAL